MRDFAEFFQAATGNPPYPYQRRLAEGDALPQILSIPTGAGKTAAVILAWLWRRRFSDEVVRRATPRRLVYCLPMRVLVEQTVGVAERMVRALGLSDTVKVYPLLGGEVARDWTTYPEQDAMLVGTQDMLLSRALGRGYAASRSRWPVEFGLVNNDTLWVLDETQLMNSGLATSIQLDAFRRALGTYGACPSIWMSATICRAWLDTVDHPRLSQTGDALSLDDADRTAAGLSSRLEATKLLTRMDHRAPDDVAALSAIIVKTHKTGQAENGNPAITLVVVNTVTRAREIHAALSTGTVRTKGTRKQGGAVEGIPTLLLHSRFRPQDRRRQIEKLLAAQRILQTAGRGLDPGTDHALTSFCAAVQQHGLIVVSTQVVEAGVDLSSRTLVTDLAPWSSLVQRFGRCNRQGEYARATIFWMDVDEETAAAPYRPQDLIHARTILTEREGQSVGPRALPQVDLPWVPAAVIRRKDLVELFDTTPDLAGNDIDISRYIRDTEDLDVLVLWRSHVPGNEATLTAPPQRDELCPVPVGEFRGFVERLSGAASGGVRQPAFRWDFLEGQWVPCRTNDIFAGQVYLLDLGAGGYTATEGWVGHIRGGAVIPLPAPSVGSADHHGADALTTSVAWATVAAHTETVVATLQAMVASLPDTPREALAYAARWHDRGKAHAIFQGALPCDDAHPSGPWAKAPAVHRYQNPHFRHELASALAALQAAPDLIPLYLRDLVAYLVAAHHGKVRLSIRSFPGERRPADDRAFARGVWHGDLLPEIDLGGGVTAPAVPLDLAPAQLGRTTDNTPSWSERMLILRDAPHVGPFRLALLEAILRAADQRASVVVSGDHHA